MTASRENVENVVKPPKKPVFKSSKKWEETPLLKAIAETKPIKTHPNKLTKKVAIGKTPSNVIFPAKYLNIAPRAPPIPTSKISVIF